MLASRNVVESNAFGVLFIGSQGILDRGSPGDRRLVMPRSREIRSTRAVGRAAIEKYGLGSPDQYEGQLLRLFRGVEFPLEDSVDNMNVVDALFESASDRRWVDIRRS